MKFIFNRTFVEEFERHVKERHWKRVTLSKGGPVGEPERGSLPGRLRDR